MANAFHVLGGGQKQGIYNSWIEGWVRIYRLKFNKDKRKILPLYSSCCTSIGQGTLVTETIQGVLVAK